MKKTLIIIPTYNEKENIHIIVDKVFSVLPEANILVVDDNSPDGTGKIVDKMMTSDERINCLHREGKQGLGTAYVAGFKYALKMDYDYIFEMDADQSHDPKELPHFLKALEDNDLVLGSRYITGVNVVNWPLARLLLSYFGNMYGRKIAGMDIRDATGGYKGFRREVLEAIDLENVSASGYSFQVEMTFIAYVKKFRIKEIPIIKI